MLNFQGGYQVANHAGERSMSFLANRSAQRSFPLCDFGGLDRLWSVNAVENNMVEQTTYFSGSQMERGENQHLSHKINVWYIYLHVVDFILNQMQVNI